MRRGSIDEQVDIVSAPSRKKLRAASTADLGGIEELYRLHAGRVARWVGHLAGPGFDIEDLVHDVFVVAARELPRFRAEAKVTTWLYQITENLVRTARRKERVRSWIRRSRADELETCLTSAQAPPGEAIEREQEVRVVYRALNTLAHLDRSLLILFELEGMPGQEIAALTGLRPETVWVRLHRARKRFLAALAKIGVSTREK